MKIIYIITLLTLTLPSLVFPGNSLPSDLEIGREMPNIQHIENDDALKKLGEIRKIVTENPSMDWDRKNLAEFDLQLKALQDRGFRALEKSLSANHVFSEARSFSLHKSDTQPILDQNGKLEQETRSYNFYYTQIYVEKGATPLPNTILPRLILSGVFFINCPAKGECKLGQLTIQQTTIRWQALPSHRMGGDSSSGGVIKN